MKRICFLLLLLSGMFAAGCAPQPAAPSEPTTTSAPTTVAPAAPTTIPTTVTTAVATTTATTAPTTAPTTVAVTIPASLPTAPVTEEKPGRDPVPNLPAPSAPLPQPTFRVVANPDSYAASANFITVQITNTSSVEGYYGYSYRIERQTGNAWEELPLYIEVNDVAAILPAGATSTEQFELHQKQYNYQPGIYRIVLTDGLNNAAAEFTLTEKPAYHVVADPASYDVSAEFITLQITNTSSTEGGYGHLYRIERKISKTWVVLPLTIEVTAEAVILPAGATKTERVYLHQEEYDYQPGTYRIVLLDGLNNATAAFTLAAK